jgi:VTC domain-containing protein
VEVDAAIRELDPVSLERLDESSAMRRRVDTKYVVAVEQLPDLIGELSESHAALEIDGHRRFSYESVYFDTADLRCFHDHVAGRRPRFKTRSRLYRETGACFFEVKVRQDEMVKRQRPYPRQAHGTLDDGAREFLDDTLRELAGEPAPTDLAPSLSTRYDRITLGARDGGERTTVDLAVELRTMDDRAVSLRDGRALVETKSEDGGGHADELLRAAGCEPVSLSKYRLGVGLLLADDPEAARIERVRACFA